MTCYPRALKARVNYQPNLQHLFGGKLHKNSQRCDRQGEGVYLCCTVWRNEVFSLSHIIKLGSEISKVLLGRLKPSQIYTCHCSYIFIFDNKLIEIGYTYNQSPSRVVEIEWINSPYTPFQPIPADAVLVCFLIQCIMTASVCFSFSLF